MDYCHQLFPLLNEKTITVNSLKLQQEGETPYFKNNQKPLHSGGEKYE